MIAGSNDYDCRLLHLGGKISVHLEDLVTAGYQILPENLGMMFKTILRKYLRS
jgi:hypothetical protein